MKPKFILTYIKHIILVKVVKDIWLLLKDSSGRGVAHIMVRGPLKSHIRVHRKHLVRSHTNVILVIANSGNNGIKNQG